jgi:hypothetical protein
MKLQIMVLLVAGLCGCQKHHGAIFVDTAWNREYASSACERYKKDFNVACSKTPEELATELRLRFASAVPQTPACKSVAIRYNVPSEGNRSDFERGWSLSFEVGINGGEIDYAKSQWEIADNKSKRYFAEGPLEDAVQAATRVCRVVTGSAGSVFH